MGNADDTVIEEVVDDDVLTFSAFVNASGGQPYYKSVFGQYTFTALIENSTAMVKSVSRNDREPPTLNGFLSVSNVWITNESTVDETISKHLAEIDGVTVINSALLNFFALENQSDPFNVHGNELLWRMFELLPEVDRVFFIYPVKVRPHQFIADTFKTIHTPTSSVFQDKCVCSVSREKILPKLLVRKARVEDTDDLVPVVLAESLGGDDRDFKLANLVQNQNDANRIVVGVNPQGTPVAMLCTTRSIQLSRLTALYDFSKFPAFNAAKVINVEVEHKPTLILLAGEYRSIGVEELRQGALQMHFLFFDAAEIEAEVSADARQPESNYLLDVFRHRLHKLLHPSSGPKPNGCVISGYPLNAEHAQQMMTSDFLFDFVVDITNTKTVRSEEEFWALDDPARDHAEALQLIKENASARNPFTFSQWLVFELNPSLTPADLTAALLQKVGDAVTAAAVARKKIASKELDIKVFASTLHCSHEGSTSRYDDLLLAAFKDNADYEVFFFMQPNDATPPLIVRHMSLVPLKAGLSADQSLYLMHRDTILRFHEFTVVRFEESMTSALTSFLATLSKGAPSAETVLGTSASSLSINLKENPPEACFVAWVNNEIVAFLHLTRKSITNDELTNMRKLYSVDRLVDFNRHRLRSQACINTWLMSSLCEERASFFLSEAMRQFGKTLLYYYDSPFKSTQEFILRKLFPVKPRLWNDKVGAAERRQSVSQGVVAGDTLYLISKQLLNKRKTIVETKIVVVGDSANAFALLESLVFNPFVYLTKIKLLIDNVAFGLSLDHSEDTSIKYRNDMNGCMSVVNHQYLHPDEFQSLGLYRRVELVKGRLTDIDRSSKAVIVNDKSVVDYDLLVLAVSVQDASNHTIPSLKGVHPSVLAHKGVFSLGSLRYDDLALQWVKGEDSHGGARDAAISTNVLVYGATVAAMHAIQQLIANNVNPESIVWAYRQQPELGTAELDWAVSRAIAALPITLWANYELLEVLFDARTFVKGVNLKSTENAERSIEAVLCCCVLLADNRRCDTEFFAGINDAGLVYDGGLVVDSAFLTNDPCIYGVGDFTRYSRRYKGAQIHSMCNQNELGDFVAANIVNRICSSRSRVSEDLAYSDPAECDSRKIRGTIKPKLHVFTSPRVESASLPGGLNYVRCFTSGDHANSTLLSTTNKTTRSVCALRFDYMGVLTEFLYIGTEDINPRKICRLVGKHESFLNSALVAYENGRVDDWIDFLAGPWASYLYYDAYDVLLVELKTRIESSAIVEALLRNVFESAACTDDDLLVAGSRRRMLGDAGENIDSSTRSTLESVVTEFVRDQKDFLPQYSIPKRRPVNDE